VGWGREGRGICSPKVGTHRVDATMALGFISFFNFIFLNAYSTQLVWTFRYIGTKKLIYKKHWTDFNRHGDEQERSWGMGKGGGYL
jgi:hypothetical protein